MKTQLFTFTLALLTAAHGFGQTNRRFSTCFSFGVNRTLYDRTKSNNSAGFGLGLQAQMNTESRVSPILKINADLFGGTKEMLIVNGKPVVPKSSLFSLYTGALFLPMKNVFASMAAGASIYNHQVNWGFNPSVGFYPGSKRWLASVAFTHIFQSDDISNKPFGFLRLALAVKLF